MAIVKKLSYKILDCYQLPKEFQDQFLYELKSFSLSQQHISKYDKEANYYCIKSWTQCHMYVASNIVCSSVYLLFAHCLVLHSGMLAAYVNLQASWLQSNIDYSECMYISCGVNIDQQYRL